MTLQFHVDKQSIARSDETKFLVADSVGLVFASFAYDATWEGLYKVALWSNQGKQTVAIPDEGTQMAVPASLLSPGNLRVSVVGYQMEGGLRMVTQKTARYDLPVLSSGWEGGTALPSPEPDLMARLLASVEEAKRIALDLSEKAASGYFDGENGTNGLDGHTPQKGIDYFTAADVAELNIPCRTSTLENDSGFLTAAVSELPHFYNKAEADAALLAAIGTAIGGSY